MNGKRIFGAFVLAAALFFVWPALVGGWQKVSAVRAAVAEREELLAKRQQVLADVDRIYAEYQSRVTSTDGQKFTGFVPVRKDIAEIVSALQDIAGEAGATLLEMRTSEARTKSDAQYKTLSMAIELQGSYPSMRQFLSGLEQYIRLVNVQSIEVSPDNRNPGVLRFSINADAYFIQ